MMKKALVTLIAVITLLTSTVPAFAGYRAVWEWNEEHQRYELTIYDDDVIPSRPTPAPQKEHEPNSLYFPD